MSDQDDIDMRCSFRPAPDRIQFESSFNGRPGGREYDNRADEMQAAITRNTRLVLDHWPKGSRLIKDAVQSERKGWSAQKKREELNRLYDQAAAARAELNEVERAMRSAENEHANKISIYRKAVDDYNKALEEFAFKKV